MNVHAVCHVVTERLMPERELFTRIYREGKLPNNGTNNGIHRCENAQKSRIFRRQNMGKR